MLTKLKALSSGKRLVLKMNPSSQNKFMAVNQNMQNMLMTGSSGMRAYSAAAIPAAVTEMENSFGSSMHQTYNDFTNSELSFDSVLESMVNLEKEEMTFDNFT